MPTTPPRADLSPAVVDAFVDDCAAVRDNLHRLELLAVPAAGVVIPTSTAELVEGMSAYGD